VIINLPWPDRGLSPNARSGHWAVAARLKRNAREDTAMLVRAELGPDVKAIGARLAAAGSIPIEVRFYPPDRRRRDDDNMVASFKAARDGLADALGVDDRKFRPRYVIADPEKPGRVEITLP
jgi:Holliday junction resolvase RusA-like endonuclease